MIVNGHTVRPADREEIKVLNPVTGETVGTIWKATEEDVDRVLDAANEGYKTWSRKTVADRAELILRYADLLEQNDMKIATTQVLERGKTLMESLKEVRMAAHAARGFAEAAKHLYGKTYPASQRGVDADMIFTRYEPMGVVLCIAPYNHPLHLATQKMIPALVMGNTVIIKPPTEDPLALMQMVELLVEAGVPAECAGVLCAGRELVTEKIIKSSRIQAVSLTGGNKAGVEIYKSAAEKLHRVFLELGGNDPFIIMDDADVDRAVTEIINSRLFAGGQSCSSAKRIIVHESIHDELLEKLLVRIKAMKRGDLMDSSTELSYNISPKHADDVLAQIQLTIDQGAECVLGGFKSEPAFVEPTVLVNVTRDMDIAKDMEIFGPVVPLIKYSTMEEAIEIANQTSYGLEGGVLSRDLEKAIGVATQIVCGTVIVNGASNYRHVDMAFGGAKASGIGREGISVTLKEFSNEKNYVIKGVLSVN